jgi:hypothetical protein
VDLYPIRRVTAKFKENFKKSLSNIFYSLLEDKLLMLFNNPSYSFAKKCIFALVQIVGVWNMYIKEKNTAIEEESANKRKNQENDIIDDKKLRTD